MTLDKLNVLVQKKFESIYDKWMEADNQKEIQKAIKPKKKKDVSGKKKGHSTAYLRFWHAERQNVSEQLKAENLPCKITDVTAKIGALWNEYKVTNPKMLEENYGYDPNKAKSSTMSKAVHYEKPEIKTTVCETVIEEESEEDAKKKPKKKAVKISKAK